MTEDIKKYNHVDLLFPSQWLKAADFRGKTVTVMIERIDPRHELKRVDGSTEKKPVIYFRGDWKPMVLGKTNGRAIAALYGTEITAWFGKTIMLRSEKVSAFGKMVDAIRVVPERPRTKQAAAKQEEPPHNPATGEISESWDGVGPPAMSDDEAAEAQRMVDGMDESFVADEA